jgi:hypothetical protein
MASPGNTTVADGGVLPVFFFPGMGQGSSDQQIEVYGTIVSSVSSSAIFYWRMVTTLELSHRFRWTIL